MVAGFFAGAGERDTGEAAGEVAGGGESGWLFDVASAGGVACAGTEAGSCGGGEFVVLVAAAAVG